MQTSPSTFVTKLAYALIGDEALAQYNKADEKTGGKKNKNKGDDHSILGEYILIFQRQLDVFLRYQGYPQFLINRELSKIGIYLNRACSYARKKTAGDEKTGNSSTEDPKNLDEESGSDDESY